MNGRTLVKIQWLYSYSSSISSSDVWTARSPGRSTAPLAADVLTWDCETTILLRISLRLAADHLLPRLWNLDE